MVFERTGIFIVPIRRLWRPTARTESGVASDVVHDAIVTREVGAFFAFVQFVTGKHRAASTADFFVLLSRIRVLLVLFSGNGFVGFGLNWRVTGVPLMTLLSPALCPLQFALSANA